MAKNTKAPAMVLQELCVKKQFAPPNFEIMHCISGTHENRFEYRVRVAGIEATGVGSSKQIGKQEAAHNALKKLEESGIYDSQENPVDQFKPLLNQTSTAPSGSTEIFKSSPNCIGPLKDLCLEHKMPEPVFTLMADIGPPHCKEFTFECTVASLKTVAKGSTKKIAKQLAAQDMLKRITDVMPELAASYNESDANAKALPEVDDSVLKAYNELYGSVIPDKTVKIADYSHTVGKLMVENEKTIDDFAEDLGEKTQESLERILSKLGLELKLHIMQSNPHMIALVVTTDTPFTVIGISKTSFDSALADAVSGTFDMLQVFLTK